MHYYTLMKYTEEIATSNGLTNQALTEEIATLNQLASTIKEQYSHLSEIINAEFCKIKFNHLNTALTSTNQEIQYIRNGIFRLIDELEKPPEQNQDFTPEYAASSIEDLKLLIGQHIEKVTLQVSNLAPLRDSLQEIFDQGLKTTFYKIKGGLHLSEDNRQNMGAAARAYYHLELGMPNETSIDKTIIAIRALQEGFHTRYAGFFEENIQTHTKKRGVPYLTNHESLYSDAISVLESLLKEFKEIIATTRQCKQNVLAFVPSEMVTSESAELDDQIDIVAITTQDRITTCIRNLTKGRRSLSPFPSNEASSYIEECSGHVSAAEEKLFADVNLFSTIAFERKGSMYNILDKEIAGTTNAYLTEPGEPYALDGINIDVKNLDTI